MFITLKKCRLFVYLLAFTSNVYAAPQPLTTQCLQKISMHYEVSPIVLLAILYTEGGTAGKNSRPNVNGSYDIGLFQINTTHLDKLSALGISEQQLRNDGCLNAAVAAWHLRSVFPKEEEQRLSNAEDYLSALARYHSQTPKFNQIYAQKLAHAFSVLYAQPGLNDE